MTEERRKNSRDKPAISYALLALILAVFVFGMVATKIGENIFANETVSFSTVGLLGFFLSVLLSGATIILAIAAITLGRSSEQAVIRRSDESIRLQNEVFIKTTAALQRIEASTGVTEKRIEDIISGRVGDISHRLAELASSGHRGPRKSTEELEKEIHDSLLEAVSEEDGIDRQKRRKERERARKEYEKYHQEVLSGFEARKEFQIKKKGHGDYRGEGKELFDGFYKVGNKKYGVSALATATAIDMPEDDAPVEYFSSLASAIVLAEVDVVYLVADISLEQKTSLEKRMVNQLKVFKNSPHEHIHIISANIDTIEKDIEAIKIPNGNG